MLYPMKSGLDAINGAQPSAQPCAVARQQGVQGCEAGQRIQVLNYHRTVADAASSDIHTISDLEFDRHLNILAAHGIHVSCPSAVTQYTPDVHPFATCFTFDDGHASDLPNATKLRERGWSGLFFISTSLMDTPGHLQQRDIRELADMGMMIGSHSHEHVRLTTLPLKQAEEEVRRSKEALEQLLGRPVQHFAFPGGAYNADLLQVVRQAGFQHVFGTTWGPIRAGQRSTNDSPLRRNNVVASMTAEDVLKLVTLANHNWRTLVFASKCILQSVVPEKVYRAVRAQLTKSE